MIVVMSLWRNDANRNLRERALHLLDKKRSLEYEAVFLWAVGDCNDDTYEQLCGIAVEYFDSHTIFVLRADTGIVGEDVDTRRMRSSATATRMFAAFPHYYPSAKYVMLHESDLQSPPDVIDRLLECDPFPCAGWPIITLADGPQFYDTWAYRYTAGDYFTAGAPQPQYPFRVRGFGSVWAAPAHLVAGRVLKCLAIRELCEQWWEEGVPMFCDPRVIIEQPTALWSPS